MDKLNTLEDHSFTNHENKEGNKQIEKVLCNYCGRTVNNGIRCLGICVADSDY